MKFLNDISCLVFYPQIITQIEYCIFHRLMADHSYHTKKNSKIVQVVDPLYDVDIDDIVRNIDIDYIPDFFVFVYLM